MPFNATADLPWNSKFHEWTPFRIDALGLVTLLGAEEINTTLGRLVPSRYLEYFPLLGAFVIAGERFKDKRPSFNFYNLTDGINTTDLSFWLTRWMIEQEFEMTRSVVYFEIPDKPRPFTKWHIVSGSLSFIFVGFLVAMTMLIGDWYGFANAIAMIISILARAYSMQTHRNAIDRAALEATKGKHVHPDKKALMILSDNKAVTVYVPGQLIVPVLSYNPEPQSSWTYHLVRYINWAVFGVHIVTIGMATLLPQIYTVALLVFPTVLTCWKLGCDDSKWQTKFDRRVRRKSYQPVNYTCWIGTRIRLTVTEWPPDVEFEELTTAGEKPCQKWRRRPKSTAPPTDPNDRSKRRQDLYAWLNLTPSEEDSMSKWDLLPHVRNGNESWWETYQAKKALIADDPPDMTLKRAPVVVGTHSLPDSSSSSIINDKTKSKFETDHVVPPGTEAQPVPRSRTWLTSNGFIAALPSTPTTATAAPVAAATPTAAASVRAGMMGLLPAIDPHRLQLTRRAYSGDSKSQNESMV